MLQYARRHDFNGFYDQEIEFRAQLEYPPFSRMALLTLRGRNEDKVKFGAEHLRRDIETATSDLKDMILKGPGPAPLFRAQGYYRYHLTLHARHMTKLSRRLARLTAQSPLPEDVTVAVDIDPVSLL